MGDLSGAFSSLGGPYTAGAQAAFATINAAGGVNGHKINTGSPIDAQSTATGAEAAARQVISQNTTAILGDTSSSETAAISGVLGQSGIPTLWGGTDEDLETTSPAAWFYGASSTVSQGAKLYTEALQSYFGGSIKGKRIAIVSLQSATLNAYIAPMKTDISQAGGSVVDVEFTQATMTSFASQAGKIDGENVDAVLTDDLPTSTVLEVSALADAGYHGVVVGGVGADDDTTLEKGAAANSNFIVVRETYVPVVGDVMASAAEKYGYSKQLDSIYFSKGWLMAYALAAALKSCGSVCQPASLEKSLDSLSGASSIAPGVGVAFGPLTFTPTKHAILTTGAVYKWDGASNKAVLLGEPVQLGAP
jgi:ABC-type branched-subunit amino acid transport system substrate-binding protein